MHLSQLAICVRTSQMKLTALLIAFSIATPAVAARRSPRNAMRCYHKLAKPRAIEVAVKELGYHAFASFIWVGQSAANT